MNEGKEHHKKKTLGETASIKSTNFQNMRKSQHSFSIKPEGNQPASQKKNLLGLLN